MLVHDHIVFDLTIAVGGGCTIDHQNVAPHDTRMRTGFKLLNKAFVLGKPPAAFGFVGTPRNCRRDFTKLANFRWGAIFPDGSEVCTPADGLLYRPAEPVA